MTKKKMAAIVVALGAVALVAFLALQFLSRSMLLQLTNGRLEGADYWRDEPVILSAGLGFDNTIGFPELSPEAVRQAGGSWYGSVECTNGQEPSTNVFTSAAVADNISQAYEGYADYDDGLPVVFSWPVATETVDPTDFQFTLNSWEMVFPHAAGMNPNWENNERNTVVVFGDFGNRQKSTEPDALFPVKLEIVADATPLLLIGPRGQEFNAVGLTWTTDKSPYDQGPVLVGAKLNYVGEQAVGEGGVFLMERAPFMPNDEFALYDEGDFRLRVLEGV
jgi:hypothetical protein